MHDPNPTITPPPATEAANTARAIADMIEGYPADTDHTSIACGVLGVFRAACRRAGYNTIDEGEAMRILADCARISADHV